LAGIFVSYRRNDSQGEAGRLFDDLANHFGEHTVFMDVAAIEAGRDFRKAIEEGVTKCGVLLVVMGPEWLTAKNEQGARRLDDPADFVRIETAAALRRDIPVIPVLVRGGTMPAADKLPDDLKELAYRNGVELTHARWRSDVQLLVAALQRLLGGEINVGGSEVSDAARVTPVQRVSDSAKFQAGQIEPVLLQRVSRELAVYIGQIAEVVVRRAAQQCTSAENLYLKVAKEIDSLEDRERFLQRRLVPSPAGTSASVADAAKTIPATKGAAESSASPEKPIPVEASHEPTASGAASRRKYLLLAAGGGVLLIVLVVGGARLMLSRVIRSPERQQATPTAPFAAQPTAPITAPSSRKRQQSETAPPSPSPAAGSAEPQAPGNIRLPTDVSLGLVSTKVEPTYPIIAQQANVQGEVVLDANISKEGTVESLRVISGHPLLAPAAMDSVKQWQFKPYMVNGKRVGFSTEITVKFTITAK